ncbi:MAG: B12-binding domain-containing radical SAM protein [Spirochaetales bacterium]|nr:B12-binding domain-containing radical SAM protein [Spirochaetales bacterium]
MNILLVYPETPTTFWSFKNALRFISKRSSEPPLGLITIAAMLPENWNRRLIDTNVTRLSDQDIKWADLVFLSGMDLHRVSFVSIVARCKSHGKKIVGGGPFCSMHHSEIEGVDFFVLNEAEITLPQFIADFQEGKAKKIYETNLFSEIGDTPVPQWDLLDLAEYAVMDIQYSRGCPFSCDFCSVTALFGHKPRCKSTPQLTAELDALYQAGWRGKVFVVDDNFIGNKRKLKEDLLPGLIEWSRSRGNPFLFSSEVSINLADDEELIDAMVAARFEMVFMGIETPDQDSLNECGKVQNQGRDMVESVKLLQRKGLRVTAGFIVGFDNDQPDIFDRQIGFIQKSGIVTAMVGLLNAQKGTRLFERLSAEDRILKIPSGDNMDGVLNFIPKLSSSELIGGYQRLLKTIYSQQNYFERVKTYLSEFQSPDRDVPKDIKSDIVTLLRAMWHIGILEKGSKFFWKLMFYVLYNRPQAFAEAVRMSIYGYHFRRVVSSI